MGKILKIGPIFIIVAALLWSLDGVLRISLYSVSPSVIVFYEHLLGALVLLLLAPHWWGDLRKMTKKEWIAISLVALFSGALGTILYTAALQKVNFIQYSVVVLLQQQLQPIWVVITAAILLKERISKRFIIWAGVALIAAYFVTFKNLTITFDGSASTAIAALFAVLAGMMWGSSTALSKITLKRVSFLTATVLRFWLAPVFALFFVFGSGSTGALFTLNPAQWLTLLAITFSTGMVAIVIYYFGLRKTPARVSTICELVWPASAVLIDIFYYHKSFSLTQILGIVILLYAIYEVIKLNMVKKGNF